MQPATFESIKYSCELGRITLLTVSFCSPEKDLCALQPAAPIDDAQWARPVVTLIWIWTFFRIWSCNFCQSLLNTQIVKQHENPMVQCTTVAHLLRHIFIKLDIKSLDIHNYVEELSWLWHIIPAFHPMWTGNHYLI